MLRQILYKPNNVAENIFFSKKVITFILSTKQSLMYGNTKPVDLQSLSNILYEVCEILEVKPEKVISKSRKREVVLCREIIVYVARETTKNTFLTIGQFLGGRDHTTCLNNLVSVKSFFDTNDELFMNKWNLFMEKSKIWQSFKSVAYDKYTNVLSQNSKNRGRILSCQ